MNVFVPSDPIAQLYTLKRILSQFFIRSQLNIHLQYWQKCTEKKLTKEWFSQLAINATRLCYQSMWMLFLMFGPLAQTYGFFNVTNCHWCWNISSIWIHTQDKKANEWNSNVEKKIRFHSTQQFPTFDPWNVQNIIQYIFVTTMQMILKGRKKRFTNCLDLLFTSKAVSKTW